MDFIQIIVIVGIIGFYFYRNVRKELAKEQKRDPSRRPDNLTQPDGEPADEEEAPETDTPRPAPPVMTATPPPPRRHPARPAASPPQAAKHPGQTAPPAADDISLRTAEEARRAFIYSEIFNRKY